MFPGCCLSLPGRPERSLNHWFSCGSSPSQRQAKRLLGQIVDRCRNGPGFHNDVDGNSTVQEIPIPASKVGLVIGKGGETIKQLQVHDPRPSSTSAGLHFLRLPSSGGLVMALACPSWAGCASRRRAPPEPLPRGFHTSEHLLWPGLMPTVTPRPGVPLNRQHPLWQ